MIAPMKRSDRVAVSIETLSSYQKTFELTGPSSGKDMQYSCYLESKEDTTNPKKKINDKCTSSIRTIGKA